MKCAKAKASGSGPLKPLRPGKIGWQLGTKFRVVSRKKWGATYVYKLRFSHHWRRWYEYHEHRKLLAERCFAYSENGDYIG